MEKTSEVTPGTLDIKSRPTRCQKGLQLQLICCTPFRLLSPDFGMGRMEDWRLEDQREDQVGSQSRTQRTKVEMRIYSIFELKYLHDKSEVFILR